MTGDFACPKCGVSDYTSCNSGIAECNKCHCEWVPGVNCYHWEKFHDDTEGWTQDPCFPTGG